MATRTVYATATDPSLVTGDTYTRSMNTTGADENINVSVKKNGTNTEYLTLSQSDWGNGIASGSQNYTFVLEVATGSSLIYGSIRIARYNSVNVQQTASSTTSEQQLSSAGEYTFNVNAFDAGTFSAGDYLVVEIDYRNNDNKDTYQVTVTHNTAANNETRLTYEEAAAPVNQILNGSPGALTLTGNAGSFSSSIILAGVTGLLTLTGLAGAFINTSPHFTGLGDAGALTLTGQAASVSLDTALNGSPGTLTLTGNAGSFHSDQILSGPTPGALTLTGQAGQFVTEKNAILGLEVEVDSYADSDSAQAYSGDAGHKRSCAQSFTPDDDYVLTSATFEVAKFGSPTGNFYAKLYASDGNGASSIPTGSALATSSGVDISGLTTEVNGELVNLTFPVANRYTLRSGTEYFIAIEYTGGDLLNRLQVRHDGSSPSHAGHKAFADQSYVWITDTEDLKFYVYGSKASILTLTGTTAAVTAGKIRDEEWSTTYGYTLHTERHYQNIATIGGYTTEIKPPYEYTEEGSTHFGYHLQTEGEFQNLSTHGGYLIETEPGRVHRILGLDERLVDSYGEENRDSAWSGTGNDYGVGQPFTLTTTHTLSKASFWIRLGDGSPGGTTSAYLYASDGGSPSKPTGSALATSTTSYNTNDLDETGLVYEFEFAGYTLEANTEYFIVVRNSLGDNSNYPAYGIDGSSPTHSGHHVRYALSQWYAYTNSDTIFYLYAIPHQELTLVGKAGSFYTTAGGDRILNGSPGDLTLTGQAGSLFLGTSQILSGATGTLTLTGQAGAVSLDLALAAQPGDLTLTGLSGSLFLGTSQILSGATGDLTLTGLAGAVGLDTALNGASGTLTLTGLAGDAVVGTSATLSGQIGNLALTGQAGSAIAGKSKLLDGALGSLALTGTNGSIITTTSIDRVLSGTLGSLSLTGQAGSVLLGTGRLLDGAPGSLTLTGQAGALRLDRALSGDLGTLTLTGLAGQFVTTGGWFGDGSPGALALTGQTGAAGAGTGRLLDGQPGSLALTGVAGSVVVGTSAIANGDLGALTLTGATGSALTGTGRLLDGAPGSLALSGLAGSLRLDRALEGSLGSLVLSGKPGAFVTTGEIILVGQPGSLTLTGLAGSLRLDRVLAGSLGSLALSGEAGAVVTGTGAILSGSLGSLTLSGQAGSVLLGTGQLLDGSLGSLTLTGIAGQVIATSAVDRVLSGSLGTLTLSGTNGAFVTTGGVLLTGQPGSLALTGLAGAIRTDQILAGSLGNLVLTGLAGEVQAGTSIRLDGSLGSLTLTGLSGSVATGIGQRLDGQPGTFTLTGLAGFVPADRVLSGALGSLALTGASGDVIAGTGRLLSGSLGSLVLGGYVGEVFVGTPGAFMLGVVVAEPSLTASTSTRSALDGVETTKPELDGETAAKPIIGSPITGPEET